VMSIVCACLTACTQWQSTITVPAHDTRHVTLELTTDARTSCERDCTQSFDRPSGRYAMCLGACRGSVEARGTCDLERADRPRERCLGRRRQQALAANQDSDLEERRRLLLALPDCTHPTLEDQAVVPYACADVPVGQTLTLKTVEGRCADQRDPTIVDCSERKVDSGAGELAAIISVVLGVVAGIGALAALKPDKGW